MYSAKVLLSGAAVFFFLLCFTKLTVFFKLSMTSEYLLRKDSAEIHLGRDLLKKRRVCNGTTAKKVFNKIQHIMADEKVLLLFQGGKPLVAAQR